jgi:hypothetical protein
VDRDNSDSVESFFESFEDDGWCAFRAIGSDVDMPETRVKVYEALKMNGLRKSVFARISW